MALGNNVKHFRQLKNLKIGDIERLSDGVISRAALNALEKRDSRSSEFAPLLSRLLNIPLDVLMDAKAIDYYQIEPKAKQEVQQYGIDIMQHAQTPEQADMLNELASHFVVLPTEHRKQILDITNSLYSMHTKLMDISRRRAPPADIIQPSTEPMPGEIKKGFKL